MTEADRELIAQITQTGRERMTADAPPPGKTVEPQTIHFSELPEAAPGGPLSAEWNFYRREVGRLLGEGNEGRWVLIKGEEIVGIWDAREDADRLRVERYPMQAVLIHQVLVREPVLRGGGYNRRWH